jgi:hypothetical protein
MRKSLCAEVLLNLVEIDSVKFVHNSRESSTSNLYGRDRAEARRFPSVRVHDRNPKLANAEIAAMRAQSRSGDGDQRTVEAFGCGSSLHGDHGEPSRSARAWNWQALPNDATSPLLDCQQLPTMRRHPRDLR